MSIGATPPRGALPPALTEAKPAHEADPAQQAQARQLTSAARQFEGLLLQQVLKALWETAPGLSGPSAGMYQQMFQGPLADHLAQGGGIGLRPLLERALRHENTQPASSAAMPRTPGAVEAPAGASAAARMQTAAAQLLEGGGERWSRTGTLQAADLMPDPNAVGGSAASGSIRDARGYQGYYKCNLFALEMARRAGFAVPTVQHQGSAAYPLSNDITRDAADGKLRGEWAKVVTGTPTAALDAGLRSGERALMLTGEGQGERRGHMAVVERVRSVDYGPDGQVQRVVFDGWEARPDGARHLRERTWNLHGHEGGHDARNGFQRIEILELRGAEPTRPK